MSRANAYCDQLGIAVPTLEAVRDHPDANVFALMLVALLERGESMTLAEVAERFERANVAPLDDALASLKRCRPRRAPVYRTGDHYALDPHDDELDLWVFRLGLRPPRVRSKPPLRLAPSPIPDDDEVTLSIQELDEAWRSSGIQNWSAQRIALAVLDAHVGPMLPAAVIEFVNARTPYHRLSVESSAYWRSGAAIRVADDGRWEIAERGNDLRSARRAVRERIAMDRKWADRRQSPAELEAVIKEGERLRQQRGDELSRLRRLIVHGFPAEAPEFVVLLDVQSRGIETYAREDLEEVRRRLTDYDVIAALDVRRLLHAIAFAPAERRLAELGPPQKSIAINQRGRTLKITTAMLIQGSCGVSRPLGDEKQMRGYLEKNERGRLVRRLEADAKALFALYQYGRLHGHVRLRWGFLDTPIGAPWAHRDERGLYAMKQQAAEQARVLEVVVGLAPGWEDSWARAIRCRVVKQEYSFLLVDELGRLIVDDDVQQARLSD